MSDQALPIVRTDRKSDLKVEDERKTLIENSVGQWNFSAHDFTSDELVFAAYTIFQHALQLPELKKWRLADGTCATS